MPAELASTLIAKQSIRAPPNSLPIIIIGQDECVFAQYLLSGKMWMGPNKEAPLLPKSDGEGCMISAFQSHDFGFGLPFPPEALSLINEMHCHQNILILWQQLKF